MAKKRDPLPKGLSLIALGVRLRIARDVLGISQGELAAEIPIRRASIADWERGRAEPGALSLGRAARHLGVSLDWLVSGHGEGPNVGKKALRTLIADIETRIAAKS